MYCLGATHALAATSLFDEQAQREIFRVPDSVALGPKVETVMPLREVAAAALTHSDNTAGNILLKRIGGPSAVTAAAREFGDEQTRLDRWEPDLNDVGPGRCVTRRLPPRWLPAIRPLLIGGGLKPEDREVLVGWMRPPTSRRISGFEPVFRQVGPLRTRPVRASTESSTMPASYSVPKVSRSSS